MSAPRAYRFDHFRLDLAKQRLCGTGGEVLPVSGRAYDVLLYLVENRDRVVTKDELLKAVWPRTFVEENNLNQAVSSLRRALGDSREAPRLILTVAGRGYRFIGDAQPETAATAVRPAEPAMPPKSVAVLPFLPLVGASGDQALELGMADTLINRLSALPGVAVAPLSSVRRFAGVEVSPISAGEELHVSSIVEGHIQVRDGRVHVNARLLQVADGTAAWSGSFDERIGDFFAVQNALAGQLANALAVHLTDDARRQLSRRHTNDVEAWQLYINGQYQFSQRNGTACAAQSSTSKPRRRAIRSLRCPLPGCPTPGPCWRYSTCCHLAKSFPRRGPPPSGPSRSTRSSVKRTPRSATSWCSSTATGKAGNSSIGGR